MTTDETVQAIYEGMRDATCLNHGPHCETNAAQIRDAIRVGLQRAGLDEQQPAAPASVQPPATRAATLTPTERTMLSYALDLAQEEIYSRGDEFSADDQAAVDSLRRVADEEQPATEAQPRPGDQFEQWLKAQRDSYGSHGANDRDLYDAFDALLDHYRLHADTGTPLGERVCEGRAVGDCDCLEQFR